VTTIPDLAGLDSHAEHPNPDGGSVFSLDADRTGLPAPVARVRPS
jgi:hypothetical protein